MTPNERYWEKRRKNPVYIRKQMIYRLRDKYKGFKFEYIGDTFVIEVLNPFRIMTNKSGLNLHDDATYNRVQNDLRKKIKAIDSETHMVIVEPTYTQVYLSKIDNVDAVCDAIKDFVVNNLEIYGAYKKNGKAMGKKFMDG